MASEIGTTPARTPTFSASASVFQSIASVPPQRGNYTKRVETERAVAPEHHRPLGIGGSEDPPCTSDIGYRLSDIGHRLPDSEAGNLFRPAERPPPAPRRTPSRAPAPAPPARAAGAAAARPPGAAPFRNSPRPAP